MEEVEGESAVHRAEQRLALPTRAGGVRIELRDAEEPDRGGRLVPVRGHASPGDAPTRVRELGLAAAEDEALRRIEEQRAAGFEEASPSPGCQLVSLRRARGVGRMRRERERDAISTPKIVRRGR
jgi:hypothetical protein